MTRRSVFGLIALVVVGVALGACATAPPQAPSRPTRENLTAQHRDRARELERTGHLRRALDAWAIILTIDPEDQLARDERRRLAATIEAEVARRLALGREATKRGDHAAARRHFLATLALDSANVAAFESLRDVKEVRFVTHTVQPRETLASIAERYYGDPSRLEVIWETNQLPPDPRLTAGMLLRIPEIPGTPFRVPRGAAQAPLGTTTPSGPSPRATSIATEPPLAAPAPPAAAAPAVPTLPTPPMATAPPAETTAAPAAPPPPVATPSPAPAMAAPPPTSPSPLITARVALQQGDYDGALLEVDRALEEDPAAAETVELKKSILYALGKSQLGERRFEESYETLRQLAKLAPQYRDTTSLLREAREVIVRYHYTQGLRLFQEEKLEPAIAEWKAVLEYEPGHEKAKRNLEQAEHLLQNLRQRMREQP